MTSKKTAAFKAEKKLGEFDSVQGKTYGDRMFKTKQFGENSKIMSYDDIGTKNSEMMELTHSVRKHADKLKSRAFHLAQDSMGLKSCPFEGLKQIENAGRLSAVYQQVCKAMSALEDELMIYKREEVSDPVMGSVKPLG